MAKTPAASIGAAVIIAAPLPLSVADITTSLALDAAEPAASVTLEAAALALP